MKIEDIIKKVRPPDDHDPFLHRHTWFRRIAKEREENNTDRDWDEYNKGKPNPASK